MLSVLLYYNTANTGLGLGPRGLWESLEAVGTGHGVSASSRRCETPRASSMAFTSGTGWLHWRWTKLSFQVPPNPNLLGFCDSEAIWCCCWVSGTPGQGGSGVCLWRGRVNEQGMCPLCLNPSLRGVTPQGRPVCSHQGTSSAGSQLPGSPIEAGTGLLTCADCQLRPWELCVLWSSSIGRGFSSVPPAWGTAFDARHRQLQRPFLTASGNLQRPQEHCRERCSNQDPTLWI